MKVNKLFIVSLLLLAILTLGAASAAENVTADDLAVEDAGDVDLEVPASEDISTDSDTDDVAVSDNVTYEESDDVLGAGPDEELSAGRVNPTYTYTIDLPKEANGGYYVQYGQPILVSGDFGNATGTITLKGSNNQSTVDLVDGKFKFNTTDYDIKNYNLIQLQCRYSGDDYYKSVSFSNTINVHLDDIVLYDSIYVGEEQYININLHNATGYVNITLNGVSYRERLDNGKLVQKLEGFTLGENNVLVNYEGDGIYNPFSRTLKFTYSEKENATIYSSVYKTADKNMVFIGIPFARGNTVNVTINGKKEVLVLENSTAKYYLDASEVVTELNVTYGGDSRLNPVNSSKFIYIDYVVNNENWKYYFNQGDYGKLYEFVEPGTTLDFQGSIINSNQSNSAYMDLSIPVNIISTTGDAFVELKTTTKYPTPIISTRRFAENSFIISNGGSGSNITGINFNETQIWIVNTSNVVLDRIIVSGNTNYGSARGIINIWDNNTNIILKNSNIIFKATSTAITLGGTFNCTIYNNTFHSLIFMNPDTSFADNLEMVNSYNKIINNNITVTLYDAGRFNLIENNTIDTVGTTAIAGGSNNTYIGNHIIKSFMTRNGMYIYNNHVGARLTVAMDSIAFNNVAGQMSINGNAKAFDNIVSGVMTVTKGAEAFNNTVGGLTISGADALVHDNIINGTSSINANNAQVYGNTFLGDKTITFGSSAKNVTFKNNNVIGNIVFQNKNAKNNRIVGNTIRTSADYAIDLKTFTGTGNNISGNVLNSAKGFGNDAINHAEDSTLIMVDNSPNTVAEITISAQNIKVGETAVLEITTNETSIASATVFLKGETYIVNLSNGKGSLEMENLTSGSYVVTVIANDLTYGAQNTTRFTVDKNRPPRIEVDAPAKTQWVDSNITVTIKRATGTVTLDINGVRINGQLVDGVVSLSVPDLAIGSYDFNITYSGDGKYEGNTTRGTLTVVKNKQVIIIAEDIIADVVADKFTAKFTNYIGEAIANANVTITIGDAVYPKVTDENGTVSVDLALYRGQYDANIEFKAIADEFDATTAKYTITVVDGSIMKILSVDGEGIVTGLLTDVMGNPVANAKVTATMNGIESNLTTDNDGLFKFQAQNGYQVVFSFEGDNTTTLSNASITLNNVAHLLQDSVINVADVKLVAVDTAAGEKGKAYKFTLKDAQGNAIANKNVKVVLDGKVYSVVTDANGIASFVISLNAAKTYNMDVFFLGDDDYKGATASAKVTVTKKATTLKAAKTKYTFKAKAKSKVIKATLKTSNKYLKAGKKVTIKIKGKTYTAKTNKKGALKIKLKSFKKKGTYKAKIKFAGDSTYKASSSKTIKIVIK